jgi:hypothetical protein
VSYFFLSALTGILVLVVVLEVKLIIAIIQPHHLESVKTAFKQG